MHTSVAYRLFSGLFTCTSHLATDHHNNYCMTRKNNDEMALMNMMFTKPWSVTHYLYGISAQFTHIYSKILATLTLCL